MLRYSTLSYTTALQILMNLQVKKSTTTSPTTTPPTTTTSTTTTTSSTTTSSSTATTTKPVCAGPYCNDKLNCGSPGNICDGNQSCLDGICQADNECSEGNTDACNCFPTKDRGRYLATGGYLTDTICATSLDCPNDSFCYDPSVSGITPNQCTDSTDASPCRTSAVQKKLRRRGGAALQNRDVKKLLANGLSLTVRDDGSMTVSYVG